MLEHYFEHPTRLRQMRRGPFGDHIDAFAAQLRQQGYARHTARGILTLAGKLSRFALGAGISDASQLEPKIIERFIAEELGAEGVYKNAVGTTSLVLRYLQRHGIVSSPLEENTPGPFEALLTQYDTHLRDVRGLAASTREGYMRGASLLLGWNDKRHPGRDLAELSGADVLDFISEHLAHHSSRNWSKRLCSQTRVFLRYLRWADILSVDLDRVVPVVPNWRLATIPRHLPWEKVRQLIDSIDTNSPEGMRDKAVLLVIAGLGLRGGEVRTLEISHIDWRAAELRLPRTKGRRERVLPLSQEVGAALADYLLHGRPPLKLSFVFLRHQAPVGPLTTTGGVGAIIAKHLRRTGIEAPSRGAHLLRHSLATRMVNKGVPIKDIADVLGHSSIDTTAIYTKVDKTGLAAVALPFPGGAA